MEVDLLAYVRDRMSPLAPMATGVSPRLPKVEGLRCVLFDLYGTVMISGAGDISLVSEEQSAAGMGEALEILGGQSDANQVVEALELYQSEIRRMQREKRSAGVEYPEIEIRAVWQAIVTRFSLNAERIEQAAIAYECAVNPCWEMPGAADVVTWLDEWGLLLGVISNAQFYTRYVLEGVSGMALEGGMFRSDLSVYSYRAGEGKPSRALFDRAVEALSQQGIAPEQTLFVGNDLVKDVRPARVVGFRTALFAGDQRSLRLGGASWEEVKDEPDVVLTELDQLKEVVGK